MRRKPVPHGIGMTEDLRCGVVGGAAFLQPRLQTCRTGSSRSAIGQCSSVDASTVDLIFAMTSGALTAATASGVSSNTVISESDDGLPVTANRANRSASLVSANSGNGGLMPTRTVAADCRRTSITRVRVRCRRSPQLDDADV